MIVTSSTFIEEALLTKLINFYSGFDIQIHYSAGYNPDNSYDYTYKLPDPICVCTIIGNASSITLIIDWHITNSVSNNTERWGFYDITSTDFDIKSSKFYRLMACHRIIRIKYTRMTE